MTSRGEKAKGGETLLWRGIGAGVGLALIASAAVLLVPGWCAACGSTGWEARLLPGAGVFFYALLLGALASGWRRPVRLGVQVAAGVHLVLVTLLITRGTLCIPCFLAAGGALLAAGLTLPLGRASRQSALILLPVAAILTNVGAVVTRNWMLDRERTRARAAAARVLDEPAKRPERVRLLVFVREGCPHCETFREKLAPKLTAGRSSPEIRYRPAPDHLVTPLVVASGPARAWLFSGLPTLQAVKSALTFVEKESTPPPTDGFPLRSPPPR